MHKQRDFMRFAGLGGGIFCLVARESSFVVGDPGEMSHVVGAPSYASIARQFRGELIRKKSAVEP